MALIINLYEKGGSENSKSGGNSMKCKVGAGMFSFTLHTVVVQKYNVQAENISYGTSNLLYLVVVKSVIFKMQLFCWEMK